MLVKHGKPVVPPSAASPQQLADRHITTCSGPFNRPRGLREHNVGNAVHDESAVLRAVLLPIDQCQAEQQRPVRGIVGTPEDIAAAADGRPDASLPRVPRKRAAPRSGGVIEYLVIDRISEGADHGRRLSTATGAVSGHGRGRYAPAGDYG
jgi:hypothetical protein